MTFNNAAPVPDSPAGLLAPAAEPDATEVPDWDLAWDLVRPMGRPIVPRQRPAGQLVTWP